MEDGAFGGETLLWHGWSLCRRWCRERGDFESVREAEVALAGFFFYAEAAGGSYGGGVDDIYFFIEDGVENTGKDGTAQEMSADFGDFSGVANANTCGAEGGGLGNEGAEAFGESEIRTDAAVLIGGEGGEIYGVADDAFDEVVLNLHGYLRA